MSALVCARERLLPPILPAVAVKLTVLPEMPFAAALVRIDPPATRVTAVVVAIAPIEPPGVVEILLPAPVVVKRMSSPEIAPLTDRFPALRGVQNELTSASCSAGSIQSHAILFVDEYIATGRGIWRSKCLRSF